MSKKERLKSEILQYCLNNGPMLEQMTTPAIAQHLKREFPGVPVMVIVSALGEWCTQHRPQIAG